MMAGSASTNPKLFLIALGLVVAWKISGHIGIDYFLLRFLGTPWQTSPSGKGRSTRQALPNFEPAAGD